MTIFGLMGFIARHPVNRGRGAASIARFVRWQLRSRLHPGRHRCDWVGGTKLWVRSGEHGLTGNLYTGLFEFDDMLFVLHFLREGDFFVDVGSNSGAFTILASGVRRARSVAVEPLPDTFERLEENVDLNRLDKLVTCLNLGVAATESELRFTKGHDSMNFALPEGGTDEDSIAVPVKPLDVLLDGDAPVLMKVDVEGFEMSVLEGGERTFQDPRLKVVIMEVDGMSERYGIPEIEIRQKMKEWGFSECHYDGLGRRIVKADGKNEYGNILYVRDAAFVQERVAGATTVNLYGREF